MCVCCFVWQGIRALDGDFSDHEEDEEEDDEEGGSRNRERRARERGATESSLLDEEELDSDKDKDEKGRVDSGVRFSMPTLENGDTTDELSRIQPQFMEYIVGDAEEERFSTF